MIPEPQNTIQYDNISEFVIQNEVSIKTRKAMSKVRSLIITKPIIVIGSIKSKKESFLEAKV